MQKTYSIALSFLKPFLPDDIESFAQTFSEMPYSDERAYGFRQVRQEGAYLSAVLIRRTTSHIYQLDFELGELVSQEIFVFHEIPFALDAQFKLLEVYGPIQQAPKVRAILRSLTLSGTRISPVSLLPAQLLNDLLAAEGEVQINGLSVTNFQHRDGIRGRYDIQTIPRDVAQQILQEYPRNVKRAALSVTLPNFDHFNLQVSHKGNLRIKCEEHQLAQALQHLKTHHFEAQLID